MTLAGACEAYQFSHKSFLFPVSNLFPFFTFQIKPIWHFIDTYFCNNRSVIGFASNVYATIVSDFQRMNFYILILLFTVYSVFEYFLSFLFFIRTPPLVSDPSLSCLRVRKSTWKHAQRIYYWLLCRLPLLLDVWILSKLIVFYLSKLFV